MSLHSSLPDENKARLEFGARFSNRAMKLKISVMLLGAALLLPFGSRVLFAQDAVTKTSPAPIHPEAARELVRRVREQLAASNPTLKKWAVYYEPESNLIVAQSREMVWMLPPVGINGPPSGSFEEKSGFLPLRSRFMCSRLFRLWIIGGSLPKTPPLTRNWGR